MGFSPDGRLLAVLGATDDEPQMHLVVWDIKNNKLKQSIATGPSIWITSPTFSPDGRHVAIGNLKGNVVVFNLASGQEDLRLEHRAGVSRLSWSEDGRSLFSGGSGSLKKWDLALSRPIEKRQFGKARMNVASHLVFSTDGKRAVVVGRQRELSVYAWPSCKLERTIPVSRTFLWAKFRSNGQQMLVGGFEGISIYNMETGELENEFKPDHSQGRAYLSAVLTADGRVLASGPKGRGVWNVETGKSVWETDNNQPGLRGVNLSSDGRFVASWSIPLGFSKVMSQSGRSVDFWVHHGSWGCRFVERDMLRLI